MKLFIITLLFISVSFAQNTTVNKLKELLKDKFFESTMVAVDVFDLTENKNLFRYNHKMLLHPASNMKVITSAAGLLFLGPNYKFSTKLFHTGNIIDSTLYGDLYFVGGGDPDFKLNELNLFSNYFIKNGISKVKGNLYADISFKDSLFWGSGWMWDDDPSTDEPYLFPLIVNKNTFSAKYSPGNLNEPVKIEITPNTSFFNIINNSITVDNDSNSFKIERQWIDRNNNILIKGMLPETSKGGIVAQNVWSPHFYFLTLFKENLERNGIILEGKIDTLTLTENATLIFELNRPYSEVIKDINKISYNLGAEMTLYALAEKHFGKPATAVNGIKMIDSMITFAGLKPNVYRLVDGSGVSHYNLVTAELLTSLLKYFYIKYPVLYKDLYDSFPIAGIDGSLRNRMKGTKAENNVRAKTGTLSGVSCLSGYVMADNGNMLAFSILIQNHVRNTQKAVSIQNEICKILAEHGNE